MTNIAEKDVTQSALDLVITQFKEKPNIQAFLEVYAEEMEEVQEVIFQLLTERLLDTAIGQQLDNWGEDVGEARQGRTDEDYRKAINLKIAINTSNGTESAVTSIGKLLTEAQTFITTPDYPAGLEFFTNGVTTDNTTLKKMLRVVSAGIGGLVFNIVPEEEPFGFSDDILTLGFSEGALIDSVLVGDFLHDLASNYVSTQKAIAEDVGQTISDRIDAIYNARRYIEYCKNIKNYEAIVGAVGTTLTFSNLDSDFVTASGDNVSLLKNGSIVARADFTPNAATNTITVGSPSIASDQWTCLRADTTGEADIRRYEYYFNSLQSSLNEIVDSILLSDYSSILTFFSKIYTEVTSFQADKHSADKFFILSLIANIEDPEEQISGITGNTLNTSVLSNLNTYTYPYVNVYKNGDILGESEYSVTGSTSIDLTTPAIVSDSFVIVRNDKDKITALIDAVVIPT